ncbi:GMC family oxidoreductase N-terminal domain-containing protein [Salmonella enterica]|nr:GMC family oxidoreductase N-terminal domain-containing protein [Salmonella enterica]
MAILLRSGVGPAKDLTALGIPVVKDAPVGTRLLDHAFYWMNFAGKADQKTRSTLSWVHRPGRIHRWQHQRKSWISPSPLLICSIRLSVKPASRSH